MNKIITVPDEINRHKRNEWDKAREPGADPTPWRFQVTCMGTSFFASGSFSTPWRPRSDCLLKEVVVEFNNLISGNASFNVLRNDDVIGTVNVQNRSDEGTLKFAYNGGFNRETQLRIQPIDIPSNFNCVTIHCVFETYKDHLLGGSIFLDNYFVSGDSGTGDGFPIGGGNGQGI